MKSKKLVKIVSEIRNMKKVTLENVYTVYRRWFDFKNTDRIDIILAFGITRKMEGLPLWLLLVAPSGDGKSEQIMSLHDKHGGTTKVIHEITSKTLVSGSSMVRDLAPQLDGKIMLIPDMSQLLKLHPQEKGLVWAQLRELYDGRAGRRTAMKEDPDYSGLRVTFIGGSTPVIDAQILIHQSLGTRELIYRIDEKSTMKIKEKVWKDEGREEQMRAELNAITLKFLELHKPKKLKDPNNKLRDKIFGYVDYLRYMRATANVDSYSGELRTKVYPEMATRCLKQLKILLTSLKSLDPKYSNKKALRIIRHVIDSSIVQNRKKIMQLTMGSKGVLSTREIRQKAKIGMKTAKKELNILWNLGLIDRNEIRETTQGGYTHTERVNWTINYTEKPEIIGNIKKFIDS